ncbi:MAG: ROK family transcriptional regulator [Sphaerobacter sp.]|nr:ROK family transcriptional regulator [Sphaerobacter sp.]
MADHDAAPPARPPLMSRVNTTAILELIRRRGPISRAEIARQLRLSGSTVTRLTAELIEAGLVVQEATPGVSSGGRPPILLSFNQRAAALIAVDVGGSSTTVVLADLDGHTLTRRTLPSCQPGGHAITPQEVVALVQEAASHASALGLPVRGVAIGVPSITRHQEGVVVLAPALGWKEVPLGALVREATQLPTFVENDVNLAALGEYTAGAGRGVAALVAVLVGTGIGAGIVIDGRLYRGVHDAAGEIGYLLVGRESLHHTYPGFGHLERLAGGHGIAEEARAALAARHGPLPPGWPRDLRQLTARDVFRLADRDPVAAAIVERATDYLAIAVANIAALLNPQRIVLGGGVILGNPHLIGAIRDRLAGRIPDLPEIVRAELGDEAVLVGAVALARERTSGYAFVQTLEHSARA